MRSAAELKAVTEDRYTARIIRKFEKLYTGSLSPFQREELQEIALCAGFGALDFTEAWLCFIRQVNREFGLDL